MTEPEQESGVALRALSGLLEELRSGRIVENRLEAQALERWMGELAQSWERRFGGFVAEGFPYASLRGIRRRGIRDAYLKGILVELLGRSGDAGPAGVIVNPVCVWGRHARDLARRLPSARVVATDINPLFDRIYGRLLAGRTPGNYEFRRDDIFEPRVQLGAEAVVFFGACGSLSDAAMDYAIDSRARYLICRTCCHDNIGGNTQIAPRLGLLNISFRFKNAAHSRRCRRKTGEYFSASYPGEAYPRSKAARRISTTEEFIKAARNSVDSDICRSIIDLDRFLYLAEAGYRVWYRAEMFVAELDRPQGGT